MGCTLLLAAQEVCFAAANHTDGSIWVGHPSLRPCYFCCKPFPALKENVGMSPCPTDKQLQWLRGNSAGSTNNSSGSSSGGGGGSSAPCTQQITRLGSGVPPEDFSITLGYRPMAIPQELFDRWSNVGAAKPATQAGPAATAGAGRPTGAGAASASSSSSKGPSASRRSSNSNSSEAVVPGSRPGASPSPTGSRPGSGPETHLAAGKTLAGQPSNPSGGTASLVTAAGGGGGGVSWQCDAGGGPPARRLSAANVLDNLEHHRPPQRQRTADGISKSWRACCILSVTGRTAQQPFSLSYACVAAMSVRHQALTGTRSCSLSLQGCICYWIRFNCSAAMV